MFKKDKLYCIINNSHDAWWCKDCNYHHHKLFYYNGMKYCEKCLPEELKQLEVYYMDQNQNKITI